MKALDLIQQLAFAVQEYGKNVDVQIQLNHCCYHAHDIKTVEFGDDEHNGVDTSEEVGKIIIRGE